MVNITVNFFDSGDSTQKAKKRYIKLYLAELNKIINSWSKSIVDFVCFYFLKLKID